MNLYQEVCFGREGMSRFELRQVSSSTYHLTLLDYFPYCHVTGVFKLAVQIGNQNTVQRKLPFTLLTPYSLTSRYRTQLATASISIIANGITNPYSFGFGSFSDWYSSICALPSEWESYQVSLTSGRPLLTGVLVLGVKGLSKYKFKYNIPFRNNIKLQNLTSKLEQSKFISIPVNF